MIHLDRLTWRSARFNLSLDTRLDARCTGLFGASGAGKTTLLELLAGLRRPTGGALYLDGHCLSDHATRHYVPPERRHIGYVPQDGALFPHLTVAQNLAYGQRRPRAARVPAGVPPPADTSPAARVRSDVTPHDTAVGASAQTDFSHPQICALLGLTPLLSVAVTRLSGGERQRVALGRALLSQPRLLLLDEPLAGLDAPRKQAILPYLLRIRDELNLPMLYASHAPAELVQLCDEVLVLADGLLQTQAAPARVFEATADPVYRLRAAV